MEEKVENWGFRSKFWKNGKRSCLFFCLFCSFADPHYIRGSARAGGGGVATSSPSQQQPEFPAQPLAFGWQSPRLPSLPGQEPGQAKKCGGCFNGWLHPNPCAGNLWQEHPCSSPSPKFISQSVTVFPTAKLPFGLGKKYDAPPEVVFFLSSSQDCHLNDNVMDFYWAFLQRKLLVQRHPLAADIYFFNSSFHVALTSEKQPGSLARRCGVSMRCCAFQGPRCEKTQRWRLSKAATALLFFLYLKWCFKGKMLMQRTYPPALLVVADPPTHPDEVVEIKLGSACHDWSRNLLMQRWSSFIRKSKSELREKIHSSQVGIHKLNSGFLPPVFFLKKACLAPPPLFFLRKCPPELNFPNRSGIGFCLVLPGGSATCSCFASDWSLSRSMRRSIGCFLCWCGW